MHVIHEHVKRLDLHVHVGLLTVSNCLDVDEITSLIIRISASTSFMSFDFAKRPREIEK